MEINTHWWMALPAVPSQVDDDAYRRLRKIWGDKTRFRGKDKDRKHEFVTRAWETHLMTTLWENFNLFDSRTWLTELSAVSGVGLNHRDTRSCNWSYGFRENSTRKIADIVIGFDGVGRGLGCYVIEAKRPGGKLTDKDLDPTYYLNIKHIAKNASPRKLIYCVDRNEHKRLKSLFISDPDKYTDCGVVTWEDVGGIQVTLAKKLDLPQKFRSFMAGAIQYQFCQHGIVPTARSEDYLDEEPASLRST
jgi:hypothetical protein